MISNVFVASNEFVHSDVVTEKLTLSDIRTVTRSCIIAAGSLQETGYQHEYGL